MNLPMKYDSFRSSKIYEVFRNPNFSTKKFVESYSCRRWYLDKRQASLVQTLTTAIKRNTNYDMADAEAISKRSLAVACVFTSDRHESSNFRDDSCFVESYCQNFSVRYCNLCPPANIYGMSNHKNLNFITYEIAGYIIPFTVLRTCE
jgi:hypothetical protein